VRARYTFGPGLDEIISAEVPGRSGSVFYLTDHLGSVRRLVDPSGAVIADYTYDSFGKVIEQSGSVYNPYGYTGRVLDRRSGLMYYRARYYDPSVGRFTTKDPIGFAGGDMNLYAYVSNDPVNFVDPLGLYESPTHYIVARDAAVGAVMSRRTAEIVGRAAESVDSVYDPTQLKNRAYHFSGYGDAQARVNAATTPGELGIALHTLMDVYTHEGRNPLINGIIHVWQSRLLDAWDPNSERDKIMYGDIGTTIRAWMRSHAECK